LAAAGIGGEKLGLELGVLGLFGAWLVNLLYDLKRQHHIADLIGFAIPDQLHLALIPKQQKAVVVWQRFARFQKADDILFFLFS
jgi:hypothetical protein